MAGKRVAVKATQLLAEKAIVKAIPVLGVAASAGVNALTTYWIGRRAQAYFSLETEDMQDWSESARAITGVDERRVSDWLAETTQRTLEVASAGAQSVAAAVVVAGKSTGEIIVVGADGVKAFAGGASQGVVTGVSSATGAATEAGQWSGETITVMAGTAAAGVAEIGRWMSEILGAWLAQAGQTVNQGLQDLLTNMSAATRDPEPHGRTFVNSIEMSAASSCVLVFMALFLSKPANDRLKAFPYSTERHNLQIIPWRLPCRSTIT